MKNTKFGTIGIVGQGFVGNAVKIGCQELANFPVETYDKISDKSTSTLEWISQNCQFIFVCVPTPMLDSGKCDTSIVESVISEINEYRAYDPRHIIDYDRHTYVIIKSTIPPGTCDALNEKYQSLQIIFNPEFLNARSAIADFLNQDHIIIGGDPSAQITVSALYTEMFPSAKMCLTNALTAETLKYVKNSFFATKVSFANEMYQICQRLGVDYTEMITMAQNDDRMGWEHWKVPGPTLGEGPCAGKSMLGWGGPCLIKDLQAFQQLAIDLGVDPKMMRAAWEKNLEVRPERDWEYIPSAVTNAKSIK